MLTKKKNTNFEVLKNLIENEMEIDDFKGVAKILFEDFENGLINPMEFSCLISKMDDKMRMMLVRCD